MAMRHWEKTDPERYQQIPDKQAFFAELGERAEIEIQQLQDALAGPDPPGESYLQKVGRLNMARLQAEEQVLSETVLIPGPQLGEDENFKDNEAVARHLEFMRELTRRCLPRWLKEQRRAAFCFGPVGRLVTTCRDCRAGPRARLRGSPL
jgi:hypothetical protein